MATETIKGTYYDYMCVVDANGKEYLLPDTQSASNKYMRYDSKKKCYVPIFKDKQKVKITKDVKVTNVVTV